MGDTKTKGGPLTEKLDLPRGAGGTRKRLKKLREDVSGALAITSTNRDLMLGTVGEHEQTLSKKLSSSDKKIAIEAAVRAEMAIRRQLKAGNDIRGAALSKIDKKKKECEASVFAGLIKKVEQAGLGWAALPALQEFGDALALATKQVWDADTPQVADKAADDFVTAADECVRKAKAALTTVDQTLATAKKRVADAKRLSDVLTAILRIADEIELATGSPARMAAVSTERQKLFNASLLPASDPALGLRAADHGLLDLYRLYGATRWQVLTQIRLPSALPYLLSAMKISGGLALIGTVVAEFVAGSGASMGLAWRIMESGNRLQIAKMFAALLLLSLLGIAIFFCLSALENRLLRRWHESRVVREI